MTTADPLYQVFADSLAIPLEQVNDELTYNTIPQWDSTAHMVLVAELENHFKVMLDTDDIIDMSSVAKAREILAKHGVTA
ncbi:acyl carrier protein [Aestuariibacter halophilus]|uniref:Acyl carrier protein n=1 Tax=Fluctibacter halophilus TaxID=226011 RepID=A0ABS8G3F7_9ALTE|nr:acyl carrier protein [Aestuariibacter halophilus]MCC2615110.1 acyl carrier protein [Aestuariibacter halophilus]